MSLADSAPTSLMSLADSAPHVLDELKPQPHRATLRSARRQAFIHAGVQKGYAETSRVLLQGLHRVKAHRLVVYQSDEELQRVIALEPRGLVCGDCKGVGVGLREHVVAVDLRENLPGGLLRDAVASRALKEPIPMHGDEVLVVGSGEGAAHFVGLCRGHACHVLDELDDLLLPDDDPVATLQGAGLQQMVVLPLRPVAVALDELRHCAALGRLHRAG